MRRRLIGIAAVLCLALTACTGTSVERERVAGIQLFQWTWDAIASECTSTLGPGNYAWVLTSPPQEHIRGEQWWTAYQPVSYKVESRLGTRKQFTAMVETCHKAGVKVLADAVINHMAGVDGGTGWAGSSFTHYHYPGIYTREDFHSCGTPGDDIINYGDAHQVQNCELVNLADLKTETDHVRTTLAAYLTDLQALGVDGFRIDAAKHMPVADIQAVISQLSGTPIIISEAIRASGEPIQPEDYLSVGGVFAFGVARDLRQIVGGSPTEHVTTLADGSVPSDKAYPFVTNHDTERNLDALSYKWADNGITLGTQLLLASPYGTPVLYSGYAFDSNDMGPAQDASGRVVDATCASDVGPTTTFTNQQWVCEHRWPGVAGMVDWRSVVGSAPIENAFADADTVAFDRGKLGLFAATTAREPRTITLTTGLPNGTYCDAVTTPRPSSGTPQCTDGGVEVKDGKVTLTVPARGAVALHVGLKR